MALHSKKLSFTRPIMLTCAGILCSVAVIAIAVTLSQRKDFLEDYHQINSNFTHNLAVNYTESILRENDYILGRSAMYFARDDRLNETLNVNPTQGLQMMGLQASKPESFRFEGGLDNPPWTGEAQSGNTFGRPGRIRDLLLKMLGRDHNAPAP